MVEKLTKKINCVYFSLGNFISVDKVINSFLKEVKQTCTNKAFVFSDLI